MNVQEAKERFVSLWTQVGTEWGINRTMAMIHGYLLALDEPVDTDTLMEALSISRGNANMNLRELVRWQLVYRESRAGERREFFRAEKDVWLMAQRIVRERKRRELDPILSTLEGILGDTKPAAGEKDEWARFSGLLKNLDGVGRKSSRLLDMVLSLDEKSFFGSFLRRFFR